MSAGAAGARGRSGPHPGRVEILGIGVDVVTAKEAVERVASFWREGAAEEREPGREREPDRGERRPVEGAPRPRAARQVVTLNPEMIMAAQESAELREALATSALVVPDGIGVVWASRVLGTPLPERVAGIDLAAALLEVAAREGRKVFFLGGKPGVAEEAAERLCRRCPGLRVAGVHHGYFTEAENDRVVEVIAGASPDLLLVGLGAPKQELWIRRHRDRLGAHVAIGVGGALDVFAGRVRRAPQGWQRLGLEWAYRLIQEPRRYRRMLALPRFAAAVLWDRWQRRRRVR